MAQEQVATGNEVAFEAFGVCLAVSTQPEQLMERVLPLLPPGWQPCPSSEVERHFALRRDRGGTFAFVRDEKTLNKGMELELALAVLDSQIRIHLGVMTPDMVFIHAGVVAHNGKALVMPGSSFAGKTMLVAALVRAGAIYYSDEFAVIDERGLVHPYAKPLSVRGDDQWQTDHPVESLGGVAGEGAVPLGAIVITSYRPGGEWQPRRVSAGEGAMALLANTIPARDRPEQVMRALKLAAGSAVALEGERGDADPIAANLLAELAKLG